MQDVSVLDAVREVIVMTYFRGTVLAIFILFYTLLIVAQIRISLDHLQVKLSKEIVMTR